MISEADRERLKHMLHYARKAGEFSGVTVDELEADENRLLVLAACLIFLGEAAAQLSPALSKAMPQIPWRDAKDLRNAVVHRYFEINPKLLLGTVTEDLPSLVIELEKLLGKDPHS